MWKNRMRMIVLGDSIQWGQGLKNTEKIGYIVAKMIEDRHKVKVDMENYAHSGAITGFNFNGDEIYSTQQPSIVDFAGEVPSKLPTIIQESETVSDPETVDLVLMDFGINSVSIETILNPDSSSQQLSDLTRQHFYSNGLKVLNKIRMKFPNANIIVTGYYPIITKSTNFDEILPLLIQLGPFIIGVGGLFEATLGAIFPLALAYIAGSITGGVILEDKLGQIISNCKLFATQSASDLQAAVDEQNTTETVGHSVTAAFPYFDDNNAILANNSLLWGIKVDPFSFALNPLDHIEPIDSVVKERMIACDAAKLKDFELQEGRLASVGHPNVAGAKSYAFSVILKLEANAEFGGVVGNKRTKEINNLHCRMLNRMRYKNMFLFPKKGTFKSTVVVAINQGYDGWH
jgi:hypothetical protein